MKQYIFLFISTLFISTNALSCPRYGVEKLVDVNCDLKGKIAIAGDSIVYGLGDTLNNHFGGFPKRLDDTFDSDVRNLGKPGITASGLRRLFIKKLKKPSSKYYKAALNVDIVVLYVGTNDYWIKKPAEFTIRDIKRLVKYLRKRLLEINNYTPEVIVSTLALTDRDFQRPFIKEVDNLLRRKKSKKLPTKIFFDRVKRMTYHDHLHPDSSGYNKMANYLIRRFENSINRNIEAKFPDGDFDGVYDKFEVEKFFTNPTLFDTDGDGVSDGDEIFVNLTDPLS